MRQVTEEQFDRMMTHWHSLSLERKRFIVDNLRVAHQIGQSYPPTANQYSFADSVRSSIVKDCRRYPTELQSWWLHEFASRPHAHLTTNNVRRKLV